jgi:hypothetical protein
VAALASLVGLQRVDLMDQLIVHRSNDESVNQQLVLSFKTSCQASASATSASALQLCMDLCLPAMLSNSKN